MRFRTALAAGAANLAAVALPSAVARALPGALGLALAGGALAGCVSTVEQHGFIPDEGQTVDVKLGEDTKSSVIARLGNPSTVATFDPNVWYYISDTKARRTYQHPRSITRSVTAVRFGDADVVSEVKTYGLADGKVIDYASRETPTRGRELTIIEQLFGNIGRLPGQSPNEQGPGSRDDRR